MRNRSFCRTLFTILALLLALGGCDGPSQQGGQDAAPAAQKQGAETGESSPPDRPRATIPPPPKPKLPEKVRIGFQVIPNASIIAKDLGWHEKAFGVPVEWRQFDSARDVNIAMASGSIDIGLAGSSGVAVGVTQGLPYKVIWIYDIIGDNEALVVRKDGPIHSMSDFEGKTVAAPFGATTHYHLIAAFETEGVDPGIADILDMQPPDMLAAWSRGDLDGGFVWEPTLSKLLEQNGRVLVSSGALAEKGYLTGDICVAHEDFLNAYPRLAIQFLQTEARAVRFANASPQQAAEAISRQFAISADEALRQMQSLVLVGGKRQLGKALLGTPGNVGALAETLKKTADFLVEQKNLKSAPDIEVFRKSVAPWYLQKAMEQMSPLQTGM